jgi:hypothetical protein
MKKECVMIYALSNEGQLVGIKYFVLTLVTILTNISQYMATSQPFNSFKLKNLGMTDILLFFLSFSFSCFS